MFKDSDSRYLKLFCILGKCDVVERWELKIKLDSPSIKKWRSRVTSVNWEDQDAAMRVSRVLVSYRWHGIVYVAELFTNFVFHIILRQMLGHDKDDGSPALGHG
jgi:hypothetical protein